MCSSKINGLTGSIAIVDGGKKIRFIGELGDGLLDVRELDTGSLYQVEREEDGSRMIPDVAWLETKLARDEIKFITGDAAQPPRAQVAPDYDHAEILAKDPKAYARAAVVRHLSQSGHKWTDLDVVRATNEAWPAALEDMAPEDRDRCGPKPCADTVRNWAAKCADPENPGLAEVMSMSGRVPRAGRLSPEVKVHLKRFVDQFWSTPEWHRSDAFSAMFTLMTEENERRAARGLEPLTIPSKETMRLEVNKAMCRDTVAIKWGEKAAKSRFGGAGKGASATRILALTMMDDTPLDAFAVFDAQTGLPAGRPNLCVLLDVHSRCVVGYHLSFDAPSTNTATECLRKANRPKTVPPERLKRYPVLRRIYGKPNAILTDNGSAYASKAWQMMLADFGVTMRLAEVDAPRGKAMVERFFRTLNTLVVSKLPGATRDLKLTRELNLNPSALAECTIGELEVLIDEAIYVYHTTVHSGIGMAPADAWERSLKAHGQSIIGDPHKLDVLSGVTENKPRRLYGGTIRRLGLVYADRVISAALNDDLAAAEPQRSRVASPRAVATVKVKVNPSDLGAVHVWNSVRKTWVRLPCTDQEYASGLSSWQHNQIRRWAQQRTLAFNTPAERHKARNDLAENIRRAAPKLAQRERRAMARLAGIAVVPPVGTPTIAYAEPQHDGLGPILEHQTAEDRADAGVTPNRPGRGKVKAGGKTPADKADEDELKAFLAGNTNADADEPDVQGWGEDDSDYLLQEYS